MLLRARRCALSVRRLPTWEASFTTVSSNRVLKSSVNVGNTRNVPIVAPALISHINNDGIPTSSSVQKSKDSNSSATESPIDGTVTVIDRRPLVVQLQELQRQNKHTEILNLMTTLKKKNAAVVDVNVIDISVSSAVASKLPNTVISLIDFGLSVDVKISAELGLTYIKACKEYSGESQPMWSKAVGMLETVVPINDKNSNRPNSSRKAIEQCFEEALILCANSAKWRNVLDIVEKAVANACPLTERMLSAAIICCSREMNGVGPADKMFRYMVRENVPRSKKVYSSLLQAYVRADLYDRYEFAWAQLLEDNLSRTDTLCATRIEVYGAQGRLDEAERTLEESLLKRPKQSYNALYLALLKSGNTEKALNLVMKMKETGVQPPEQHTASFHVQSLSKVGLVEEGLRFLRTQEQDSSASSSAGETVPVDDAAVVSEVADDPAMGAVSEAAWQSLFRASISHGEFNTAHEVLNFALEKQALRRSLSLPPTSSTVPPTDTALWKSQLFRAMGKAGDWVGLLSVAEKHQPLSYSDLSILLKVLCQCEQEQEAVKYHNRFLDNLFSKPHSASKGASSSSGIAHRAENFLRSVTHGFVQQLASENKGQSVIDLFDGVSDSIQRHAPPQVASAGTAAERKAINAQARLKACLPIMYTSAIRYTVGRTHSLEQALKLMKHQRDRDVKPMWSCTRYAMKAMSEESAWGHLLDIFSARAQTSDYLPGDEVAYSRALKGCSVLGRWQHSLEILADLLSEKEKPDPTSFELTLEALASHDQWEIMLEIISLVRARNVTPTPRMIAICSGEGSIPSTLREQMLRKIRDVPSSDVTLKDNGLGATSVNRGRGKTGNRNRRVGLSIKSRKTKDKKKEIKTNTETTTVPQLTSKSIYPKLKKKTVECETCRV